ncbi:MAG: bacterio-opsin activator domain-containing protein [Halolamina sp.]
MSLIAELRLSDNPLILVPSLSAAPGMRLERERSIADRMSDPVVFTWAMGGDFEQFEAAIPDDPTIQEFERIDRENEKRLYRLVVDRSVITNPAPIDRDTGASRISIETTAEGAVLEVRFPEKEALREYIDRLQDEGFTVELLRVHPTEDTEENHGLSEKQAAALREARSAGYFEVPRETDLATVADRLGISEQAVSERIRRGLSSVLAEAIDDADTEPGTGDG